MSEVTYLTQEGLNKLKKELERLMTVERPKISKQIGEAIVITSYSIHYTKLYERCRKQTASL